MVVACTASATASQPAGESVDGRVIFYADLLKLQWAALVTDDRQPLPSLGSDGAWRLNGNAIDISAHVNSANVRIGHPIEGVYTVALVSLGAEPTYGQFLRTAEALRARRLCDVLILESGQSFEKAEVMISGFSIC